MFDECRGSGSDPIHARKRAVISLFSLIQRWHVAISNNQREEIPSSIIVVMNLKKLLPADWLFAECGIFMDAPD